MKKIAKIAAAVLIPTGLVGGYLVTGFYIFPAWLQHNLPAIIKTETNLDANLGSAKFNPLTFQLELKQFEITQLLRFDTLNLDINLHQSLASQSLIIEKLALEKPFFKLEKRQNGSLNISALLDKFDSQLTESSTTFPITIKSSTLSQGQFLFQDGKFEQHVTPLNLTLSNFSTTNSTPAKFDLHANSESGGELNSNGDFQFVASTVTGNISLKNFNLSPFASLIPDNENKFTGEAELTANYHIAFGEKTPHFVFENGAMSLTNLSYQAQLKLPKLTLEKVSFDSEKQVILSQKITLNDLYTRKGDAQLDLPSLTFNELSFNLQNLSLLAADILAKDAQLFDATQNTLLFKLPEVNLKELAFNLQNKTLAIGTIAAKNADFKAWLNPNGELNYQTLLPEDEAQVASAKAAGDSTSEAFWGVKIGSVELTDFGAAFEDKTLAKPLTINISPLSLKLTELSNAAGAKLPFELSTKINDSGSLHLKGSAGLSPLTAQTQIDVNALGLEKFQSYVDKFAHLDLIKGVFSLDGKLDVSRGEQGEIDIKFKGNSGIARLITRDQTLNKDLLKWDNLTLKNIDADVLAQRYSATALNIEKPYARVVIDKNKTLNFADIFITEPESKNKKSTKTEQNSVSDIRFKLDKVKISNGASTFADLSMILPFIAEIHSLEGGASGISSEHESTINVTLKGNAYDLAPVDIKGKIQPFVGDYKAALNFKGMPLPLMSAYMAEFAGYKLENGKLSIGMNYEVEKGELNATNNLRIEQFELGEKVDNPNAIDAPIDLAMTLLKDMDGIINLEVPITGSLNDPHFDFGGIISDAFLNIISKAITSPFQAIASFLGSDDGLVAVQFSKGSSELSEWQHPKLDNLAKVLHDREIFKVEIRGTAFESDDWTELSEIALTERLKTRKSEELEHKNKQKILPEYVELDEADAQRLLAQEFAEKYPKLVKKSFFGNLELANPEMGEFYNVAKKTLMQAMPVEQKRLSNLAAQRAQAVAKYLVQEGGVPNERVFILDVAVNPPRTDTDIDTLLFLKVD
ncbi:MAG: DUF748 domain-containing protein [Methylococcales bacterium]|nr:DUF748 domain-containing protein [Methylococcales bacterium]